MLPITPWIGAETGALECRGLLVHKWGILYPLGAVKNLLARPLASAVVWSLGFGCLWLALSPPSIVKCKQYLDAVGCQSLALPASFLSKLAFHASIRVLPDMFAVACFSVGSHVSGLLVSLQLCGYSQGFCTCLGVLVGILYSCVICIF